MATRLIHPDQQFSDSAGAPLPAGTLEFFETGTSTPKNTFSDTDLQIANTNPILLNSEGRLDVDVWGEGEFKLVVDPVIETLRTYDPLLGFSITSGSEQNTIADLTAILKTTLNNDDRVEVKGYTTIGDGGGGDFVFDSTNTTTEDLFEFFETDEGGTGRWIRTIDGKEPSVLMAGALGGANNDTTIFQTCIDSAFKTFVVPFDSAGYTINTITNTTTTFIFLGNSTLNGTADENDLQAVIFEDGNYQGVPIADGLLTGKLEIVAGVIRQQVPQAVSITAVGTLATVTHVGHGYSTSNGIRIDGVVEEDFNGFQSITVNTVDEYEYTMGGSPSSPATGSPTARKNAQWDFIGGAHVQTGVSGTGAVATGSSILITFAKTYTNVVSYITSPDETLANRDQLVIGASVGLSSATIKGSMSIHGIHSVKFNGATWDFTQNNYADINLSFTSFTSGNLVLAHDFCPGIGIKLTPWTVDGARVPYMPAVKTSPGTSVNTGITINFVNTATRALVTTADQDMAFWFEKIYHAGLVFDGTNVSSLGDSSTLDFSVGNIWFYAVMEL